MRNIADDRCGGFGARAARMVIVSAGLILVLTGNAATSEQETVTAGSTIIMKDDVGRSVAIPRPVRRIVSLAPSVTETLFALGVQDRIVGDTDFCDYPPEAKKIAKIGGPFTPNLEVVLSLKPDLVLLAANTANRKETADALESLHVPAYATSAKTIDEVVASIARLGDILGASEQGRTLTESLRARLYALHRKLAAATPARVLFVVWQEPLISIGQDTFLADALHWAGAESVIRTKQDWPHLNLEEVVQQQPEYLVFASNHPEEVTARLAEVRNLPGWRDMKAIQENKVVIVIDAINRPAPRLIDAIEDLARQLHPAVFAESPRMGITSPKAGAR
jgi:iron complex transport system substrate-binding protein